MNNNQIQQTQFPNIIFPPPIQQQSQLIENINLKTEVQQLRIQLKEANMKYQEIKLQKEDLEKKNTNLQSQLLQKNQVSNNSKNIIDEQNLKDKFIEIQLHNKDLQEQMDQLNKQKEDKKRIEIKCIPYFSQNIQEEIVRLSWIENITNLQIKYQRKDKIVSFEGYGEIQNEGFIFFCQCELSKIPAIESQPQIIQKEHELFLKFQI